MGNFGSSPSPSPSPVSPSPSPPSPSPVSPSPSPPSPSPSPASPSPSPESPSPASPSPSPEPRLSPIHSVSQSSKAGLSRVHAGTSTSMGTSMPSRRIDDLLNTFAARRPRIKAQQRRPMFGSDQPQALV